MFPPQRQTPQYLNISLSSTQATHTTTTMDQSRALNALAPFVALAKSATAPRAAADLITQATSAPNTYVFAELLHQPNIQALEGQEQYGNFHELLKVFAWGTWESYKGELHSTIHVTQYRNMHVLTSHPATPNLPSLTSAQETKLRLLTLLTLAAQKPTSGTTTSNLSYASLCTHLDLPSPLALEQLLTRAIYADLLTATLNSAAQTVVVTSVAPLRDLAPGSLADMMAELAAWSGRCDAVLADLESEMERVRSEAKKRAAREAKAERQIKAVTAAGEVAASDNGTSAFIAARTGHNTRGGKGKVEEEDGEDAMEVDGGGGGGGSLGGGGKKRSGGGGMMGALGRLGGRSGR